MVVAERVENQRAALSRAERRVAEAVLADPESVAFGTVATVADRGGTSGATVVRLARRLGYDGFVGLQAAVRDDLMRRAAHRIRQPVATDVVGRALAVELANVQRSLGGVDGEQFRRAVALLAARRSQVFVLAGDASMPIVELFATELGMLRPGVRLVDGSRAGVQRGLAEVARGDVVVAVDIRRYEREVLAAVQFAARQGAGVVAVTDSVLSPLAEDAIAFVAAVDGAGPFDSHIGLLAILNAITTGVAAALRETATARLDRIEAAWEDAAALFDG